MQLIDAHCHVQLIGQTKGEAETLKRWAKSGLTPDSVIERAKSASVSKLICVGCDLNDSKLAVDYVRNRPDCWASIGLHPHESKRYVNDPAKIDEFKQLAGQDKVVAIGECGLDYFYDSSPKKDQIKILEMQLDLARTVHLPVIFHVREALNDLWPILDNFPGLTGVIHSFTDNQTNLDEALNRGFYVGVNGIATFTKDPQQLEVYKRIPLTKLILETDSPFLTPTPYRGTINEPSMVAVIAEFLSTLRHEDLGILADATTNNAQELFGI